MSHPASIDGEDDRIDTTKKSPLGDVPFKPPQYQYIPLLEGHQEIRFMTLLPGEKSSPIRVLLTPVPFPSNPTPEEKSHIPSFEALSYAWGSEQDQREIYVESCYGTESLNVTRNLGEALPCLRYKDRSRIFWIDAICVNQKDPKERSQQVGRMADIFSKAKGLNVWLGSKSEDSDVAMDGIETMAEKVYYDYETSEICARRELVHSNWLNEYALRPFKEKQFDALLRFFRRSWFERLWIWQEVYHVSSTITLMCGMRTIPWSYISDAAPSLRFSDLPWEEKDVEHLYHIVSLCRTVKQKSRWQFGSLIDYTRTCKCSDPRDRIYALLSMLPVDENLKIEPDYTKTVSEVYRDAALAELRFWRRFDLLATVEHHGEGLRVPSWVPDWSIPRNANKLFAQYASLQTKAEFKMPCANTLEVVGVMVSQIERVEHTSFGPTLQDTVKEIKRLAGIFLEPNELHGDKFRAFCLTLITVTAESYHPPWTMYISTARNEELLRDVLRGRLDRRTSFSSTMQSFLEWVAHRGRGRAMFLTKDRRMGQGTRAIIVGDFVAVLWGCYYAMVLRPTDSDKEYQLVGGAYCHGIMKGEALLGPLLNGWDVVETRPGNGMGYVNRETDVFQYEDPRLKDVNLPRRWKREEKANGRVVFVNEDSGREVSSYSGRDPRLTPEAFKERGAPLQTFQLI
ncbi:hypothetical protein NA57DRAFT_62043 [Rhizodiscina lignyota]|uniref:WW domain-containing protein n=1 Tax=Rhizodiscina lignyota TaxID=1504668 RepID=A0A9P4I6G6_9PEZI|nr:hypothetical protein NA57DRAFT_62043 [Rhizodiscina lignyota]